VPGQLPGPGRPQQRQATQRDPGQDGHAPGRLGHAGRVAEDDHAGGHADQRLQVQEGAGDIGRDSCLAVGEERERRQRAHQRQSGGGHQGVRAAGGGRHPLGDGRDGQGGERRREELGCGHRDRVAAGQQTGLGHGERRREGQRHQDQAVAGQGGAASPAGGDEPDTGERHREANPGHRARHRVAPGSRDDRDQHGRCADEQGRVAHAGPPDPDVLGEDRPAEPQRAPGQHGRAGGDAGPGPAGGDQEHGGGQPEPRDGEPAGRQPLEGQLGHGHGGAPEQARGNERGDSGTAIDVHEAMMARTRRGICQSEPSTK
jgi:hypothetical protein